MSVRHGAAEGMAYRISDVAVRLDATPGPQQLLSARSLVGEKSKSLRYVQQESRVPANSAVSEFNTVLDSTTRTSEPIGEVKNTHAPGMQQSLACDIADCAGIQDGCVDVTE